MDSYQKEVDKCEEITIESKHNTIEGSVNICLSHTMTIEEFQAKIKGIKSWAWKLKNKDVMQANGKMAKRYSLIDRQSNSYEEICTYKETGEVFHCCKEKLTEHTGHGSDKPK